MSFPTVEVSSGHVGKEGCKGVLEYYIPCFLQIKPTDLTWKIHHFSLFKITVRLFIIFLQNYHLALAALLFSSSLVIQLFSLIIDHLETDRFSMLQNQTPPGNYSSSLLIPGWDVSSFTHSEDVQWRVPQVICLAILVSKSYASRKCQILGLCWGGRVLSSDVFYIILQNTQTKENSTASKNYLVSVQVAD